MSEKIEIFFYGVHGRTRPDDLNRYIPRLLRRREGDGDDDDDDDNDDDIITIVVCYRTTRVVGCRAMYYYSTTITLSTRCIIDAEAVKIYILFLRCIILLL